ncbi:MAG: response regulator [Lachnospiraceae bacterium]|nr:response regulator [Lachnospiraceae bacterium]
MYKIILVDDEILVREVIRDKIKWNDLGFVLIQTLENGKEALGFLEENQVDVVLTDINMPYVDGIELSKAISLDFPNTKVIIFSGYGDFAYAQNAIKYGVMEYILKPVTAKELSQVLSKTKERLDQENKLYAGLHSWNKLKETYGKKESLSLDAIQFIHQNFADCDLTLKNVCSHLGLSISHFSSLFKKETGKTFVEYLNGVRMEKAKELLCETGLRNYEIAEKVGYGDPHYFSIAFKKATGMSPKKYARECADEK